MMIAFQFCVIAEESIKPEVGMLIHELQLVSSVHFTWPATVSS